MSMTIGASQSYGGYYGIQPQTGSVKNPGESEVTAPGRKSSPAECETCKERKYQDGSDEMVSYKSASHISPSASASAVRAHEQEHVSNAFKKAATDGGKVPVVGVTDMFVDDILGVVHSSVMIRISSSFTRAMPPVMLKG